MLSARASEILSRLAELESLAKNQASSQTEEGSATFAIACSPCRGNALLPSDFKPFDEAHPHIRLERTFHPSGVCLAALEEGVVDAAIVTGRVTKPGIECVHLLSSSLSLVVSQNHPLADRSSVALDELHGTPIAEPEDLRYCRSVIAIRLMAKGVDPDFVILPPYVASHRAFLEDEMGAFFAMNDPTLAALYPKAVVLPVAPEDPVSIPLCLAYAQNSDNRVLATVESYLINLAARMRKRGR